MSETSNQHRLLLVRLRKRRRTRQHILNKIGKWPHHNSVLSRSLQHPIVTFTVPQPHLSPTVPPSWSCPRWTPRRCPRCCSSSRFRPWWRRSTSTSARRRENASSRRSPTRRWSSVRMLGLKRRYTSIDPDVLHKARRCKVILDVRPFLPVRIGHSISKMVKVIVCKIIPLVC